MKKECSKNRPVNIKIDSDIFSKPSKINNNDIKILRETLKDVERFE